MKNIFNGIPAEILKKRKKERQPAFIKPMLATLTNEYFSSDDWLYEHKFDGERCLVFKKDGKVSLISRNKLSMNNEYPELTIALEQEPADNFIIDGEIVATDKAGISDFQLLQGRLHLTDIAKIKERQSKIPIAYRIFDVMYVGDYNVCDLPLLARKEILRKLLNYNKILTFTEHIIGNGIQLFKEACKKHWEGLIAKKIESKYLNKRSTDWLKFKCIMKQELVIGGFTEPRRSRQYFGALLVGYYDKNGKLKYAGKVGTGFTQEILAMLGKKMKKIEIKECPFDDYDKSMAGVHWIKPVIVAEFQFANWTRGGHLRVGRYKGLRDDKSAKDVVKETPKLIGPKK